MHEASICVYAIVLSEHTWTHRLIYFTNIFFTEFVTIVAPSVYIQNKETHVSILHKNLS